jgi:hypothetical protein
MAPHSAASLPTPPSVPSAVPAATVVVAAAASAASLAAAATWSAVCVLSLSAVAESNLAFTERSLCAEIAVRRTCKPLHANLLQALCPIICCRVGSLQAGRFPEHASYITLRQQATRSAVMRRLLCVLPQLCNILVTVHLPCTSQRNRSNTEHVAR